MPLYLSCSNRVEALHAQLAVLLQQPLRSPFTAEIVLVPGMAMQRWVNLHLGMRLGLAANIDYSLPAAWIWKLAALCGTQETAGVDDPLSRERAAWKIFGLLPTLLQQQEFAELQHYLLDDESGVKRWALSQRLADVFDRYQYYRPDWIRAWSARRSNAALEKANLPAWQGILWRAMSADCVTGHRVALIDRLLEALNSAANPLLQYLPERLSCFALSSLPPLFVQVLQALSRHVDVFLFQHSPTDQYWADLRSKKTQARARLERLDDEAYDESGNDLLASWGRQGQAFQDVLLDAEGPETVHWEHYTEPASDRLLHRLQGDILALQESSSVVTLDESIQIAVCHSPMRECQVLHDRILAALEADPSLQPEDILVMIPEISRYAPYIEAVFKYDEQAGRPFLPWNLSDISIAEEHPLVQIFLRLLSLPSSRFSFSELASYLEVPRIAQQFDLEGQLQEEVLSLLEASGVRWGLDGAHKASLNLPQTQQNTWAAGIDRLLAGYAMMDVELWNDIAPFEGVSGGSAQALGRFCRLLEQLRYWHHSLQQARSATQWQEALNEMLVVMFGELRDEEDKLQQIRDALNDLGELAQEQVLSIELLREWLQDSLGSRTEHHRFFSGGVSICGMRPLRSLPFRMICIVGMNDAAFPRREQSLSFDGMAAQWRPGDPRKADEDRYLLLETLLCARERLYFSYTGRSLRDNAELQPSVLLRELLDFIDLHYPSSAADGVSLSQSLTHDYPMQPFSGRQFALAGEGADSRSYDAWWCSVAQTLLDTPTRQAHGRTWPGVALPTVSAPLAQLELRQLVRFLQDPIKSFFNSRLRLLLREEQQSEDEEIFSLDGLQRWQVQQTLIARALHGEAGAPENVQALLQAQGMLPHGAMAQASYNDVQQQIAPLLQRLQPYASCKPKAIPIALVCAKPHPELDDKTLVLSGQISAYYPGIGLLHYSASSLKPKHIIGIWLEHLALCASGVLQEGETSVLICKDAGRQFAPVEGAEALTHLNDYIALYHEGLTRPLPLFPNASAELALATTDKQRKAALTKWEGGEYYPGTPDSENVYVALAHRACDGHPLDDEAHLQLAQRVYGAPYRLGETL